MNDNDNTGFSNGFAFYKSHGIYTNMSPMYCFDYIGWMKGFCCALADYDLDHEYPTIEQALTAVDIENYYVQELLNVAEHIVSGEEWCRWSSIPIRNSHEMV